MKNDLISVIVPVYNVEKYLDACVKSIINQTYKKLEIILVDDGSTDNSPSMCDEYKKKDDRIKVIHKINGGLSDARNAGLDIATGKYVTFIDSDDFINQHMINELYELINKYDSDISFVSQIRVPESSNGFENNTDKTYEKCVGRIEGLKNVFYCKDNFIPSACAKLYKTSLFKDIRYPFRVLYEDLATTYKLFDKAKKISYNNSNYYYYRQNQSSIMHQTYKPIQLQVISNAEESVRFFEKKEHEIYEAAIFRLVYESIELASRMPYGCPEYSKVKKVLKEHLKAAIKNKNISKYQKMFCMSALFGVIGIKIAHFFKSVKRL